MFPVLQIGPLALQTPGLLLLIGLWLGLALSEQEAKRHPPVIPPSPPHSHENIDSQTRGDGGNEGGHSDQLYNSVFVGLVAGLLGARLAYALQAWKIYLAHPLDVFSLNPAALSPAGGFVIGVLAAGVYGWRKGLPLRPTLDALAPGLAVFMVALAGAHLANGDAFGAPARLPWSIFLWEDYRHPSQVYEALGALLVLGLWYWRRARWPAAGLSFLFVVALSAGARVFLEAFRGDSVIWAGGWRAAQVSALAVLAVCLWLMRRWAINGLTGLTGASDQSVSSVD